MFLLLLNPQGSLHHTVPVGQQPCHKTEILLHMSLSRDPIDPKQSKCNSPKQWNKAKHLAAFHKLPEECWHKGGLSAYAVKVGKSQDTISLYRKAAKVVENSRNVSEVSIFLEKAAHLAAIHRRQRAQGRAVGVRGEGREEATGGD